MYANKVRIFVNWSRLGFLFTWLAFSFTSILAQDQIVNIHGVTYALKNGKWYAYIGNQFGTERVPERIIVRRADRGSLTDNDLALFGVFDARLASPRFLEGYYVISVTDSLKSFTVAQALSSSGPFDYVFLDGYGERGGTPNDQFFAQQWNLNLTKLRMANAWDISTGSSSIIVGIIDSGCDYGHQDLAGNIWSSIGWDFVQNDNTPIDDDKHGTAVAGIVGAITNNSIGVAGIAGGWGSTQGASLMILKDGDYAPIISLTAQAVQWAADNGAYVVNISSDWPSTEPNLPVLQSAINYAVNTKDVVAVANAGNTGTDPQNHNVRLPAAWANVIAVGQTDQNDLRKSTSSYGEALDVVAPGDVYTTDIRGTAGYVSGDYYSTFGGTSASAPHVAGLAGLIRSVNSNLIWTQVHDIIDNSADKVAAMGGQDWTEEYGFGRINAYQALLLTHAYSNKSMSATATAQNNGRRLVKTSDGKYHLVFESGITSGGNVLSEIFYRNSTDGVTWSTPVRLSAGNEQNRYPSIAERSGKLYVVWQRKTGTDIFNILFRYFNGSSWETIRNVTNSIGSNSDPLPVIAVSTPAAAFEMMVAYRINGGLKSQRTTSANGSSWGSPIVITGTSNASNPSLVYKSNSSPGYFVLSWDNGNNIYHQSYNGSSWSTPAYQVNSLSLPANVHKYSSYALSGNLDRHIVWQAFDLDVYQKWVIYHNKNLNPAIFTAFATDEYNFLRPTGSGHSSGAFSVVWHDDSNSQNIRKAYYNGSTWADGQTGTILVSNGADASLSTINPPGATAKAIWRSVGSAPYTLTLGPSGGLGKSAGSDPVVYNRRIIYSLDTTAVLALQMGTVEAIAGGNKTSLLFPVVADDDSLNASQLPAKLRLSNVALPADADSLVFTVRLYSRNGGSLRQNSLLPLQPAFALAAATPMTISLPVIPNIGVTRQKLRIAFPVQSLRGQTISLHPVLTNLDAGKLRGTLVHVYETVSSNTNKNSDRSLATASPKPRALSLRVQPNPFNPSTQIRFSLPDAGMVSLRIYDVNGRLILAWNDQQFSAGEHAIIWDGNDRHGRPAASGMYFSEMFFGTERRVAKMMLIR